MVTIKDINITRNHGKRPTDNAGYCEMSEEDIRKIVEDYEKTIIELEINDYRDFLKCGENRK